MLFGGIGVETVSEIREHRWRCHGPRAAGSGTGMRSAPHGPRGALPLVRWRHQHAHTGTDAV